MYKRIILPIIINLFLASNAYSFAAFDFKAKYPHMDGCKTKPCSCSCYDPYEPRVFAQNGTDKGICLDTCTMRSLTILEGKEKKKFSDNENEMVIANIKHNGTFYVGKIDPQKIKEIIYQVDWFGIWPQGHGQLCFVFNEDIDLIPQLTDTDQTKISKVKKLVFSIHGTTIPNKQMNFQTAMNSEITTIYMLGSLSDDIDFAVAQKKHTIEQHLLNVTFNEKPIIFRNLMTHSNNIGYSRIFNLTDNNCVSELFKVLDNSFNQMHTKINELMKTDISRFMPSEVANYFRKLGIYSIRLPDINPVNYKFINYN